MLREKLGEIDRSIESMDFRAANIRAWIRLPDLEHWFVLAKTWSNLV